MKQTILALSLCCVISAFGQMQVQNSTRVALITITQNGNTGIGTTVPQSPLDIKSISPTIWTNPTTISNSKGSILVATPGTHTSGTNPVESGVMAFVPTLTSSATGYRIAMEGNLTENGGTHTTIYSSGALGFESKVNRYVAAVHGNIFNQTYASSPLWTSAGDFQNNRTTATDFVIYAHGATKNSLFEGSVGIGIGMTVPQAPMDIRSISQSAWTAPTAITNGKGAILIATPGTHTSSTKPLETGVMAFVPSLDASTVGYRIAIEGNLTENGGGHTTIYSSGALGFESKINQYVAAVHGNIFDEDYLSAPLWTAAGDFQNNRTTATDYVLYAHDAARSSLFEGSIGVGIGLTSPEAPLHIKSISYTTGAASPNLSNAKTAILVMTPGTHTTDTTPIEGGIMSYVPTLNSSTLGFRIAIVGNLTESTNGNATTYAAGSLGFESGRTSSKYVSAVHGNVFNYTFSSNPSWTAAGDFTNARTTASDYVLYAHGATAHSYFEGKIGVGVSNPTEKLEVAGNVKATVFIATTAGTGAYKYNTTSDLYVPDYVFDDHFDKKSNNPEYYMLTLNELKKFIQSNRHLPRVPSRADISEAGAINLQGISMISLEKTEENTLYILELQEQIDDLKTMNEKILKELALVKK
jgi:hypothetical protein